MLFYVACNPIAVSVRNAAAATTGVDGQAVVAYANIWSNLPYGIIAVSVATALFTELSHAATNKDMQAYKTSLVSGLRTTTLLMLPASALLIALAKPLISLYVGGRMSAADAQPIVAVLITWTVPLVFYAGMMFMLRAFYSLKDTLTPAIANFFCTLVQILGYLLLTGSILNVPVLGVVGIPLADGIFETLLFVTLLFLLRRKIGSFDIRQFIVVFAKMAVVSLAVGALCWLASDTLTGILGTGRVSSILVVAIVGCLGLALTAVAARLLGIEEISRFGASIRRRLLKKEVHS
jgi:putative peptidoglycan lipid II flippase